VYTRIRVVHCTSPVCWATEAWSQLSALAHRNSCFSCSLFNKEFEAEGSKFVKRFVLELGSFGDILRFAQTAATFPFVKTDR
jgi:hypothetical protein